MESVKRSYDKICDMWDEKRNKTSINKCIVDFVAPLKSGASVLDIGCGTGYPIAKFLSDKGFCVVGIDFSAQMINKAKALCLKNAKFIEADFLAFDTDERFDAIIAFDSLWHIEHAYQKSLFEKLSRLLKEDGRLLFTSGKADGEIVGQMFGEKFYYSALDKSIVVRLLEENGLIVTDCIEDYEEATTGSRDLLVTAVKCPQK